MKKLVLISFILLGFFCGCSKERVSGSREVVINIGGVSSGSMTKTDTDNVAALLRATAPTSVPTLSLKSTTNTARSYEVTPGKAINLPYDTYTVTGRHVPAKKGDTFRGVVYNEPRYSVSATIEVVPDKGEYEVSAMYECFAVVIDWATTKKYTLVGKDTNVADFTLFVGSGDLGVAYIFVNSEWGEIANRVTAYPTDEAEHEATEYRLVTNRNYEGYFMEYGKWYCFAPAAVETESGSLSVKLPEWEAGTL